MNRTTTRLFGFFVAIMGTGASNAVAVIPNPTENDDVIARTTYSASPRTGSNCNDEAIQSASGVKYHFRNCGAPLPEGLAAFQFNVSGFPFSDCNHDDFSKFTGCENGYCNKTVIYCSDSAANRLYLERNGCILGSQTGGCFYSGAYGYEVPGPDSLYVFDSCADGLYMNGTGVVWGGSSPSDFHGNCAPCSGMDWTGQAGNFNEFITVVNPFGESEREEIRWYSNGTDITSCRATSVTNGYNFSGQIGVFTLTADGCPYVI